MSAHLDFCALSDVDDEVDVGVIVVVGSARHSHELISKADVL